MEKNKTSSFKNIFKKKRTWVLLIIALLVVSYFVFKPTDNSKNTVTSVAKYSDLSQTVLATGQVISETDLNLSFNNSGVVKALKVKVGDNVKAGQVLASLDQGAELASLTQARGALAAAQARLKRTIEGSSNEEISLSEIALANAKRDFENIKVSQATLVDNAYTNLLNSYPEVVPASSVSDYVAPTITGNYTLKKEGDIKITTYYTGNGASFSASGVVSGSGIVTTSTAQPIGDSGLYITFPSSTNINVSNWVITIPNKKASNYQTNYNAYQSALKNQESAVSSSQSLVDQRTAELAVKRAGARSSDIDLAKADILSAEGQMQAAQARYDNTIIKAPVDGTITKVDIKIGELAQALKEVMILQDISNMYLETNINEANIATINIGLPVDITFDAFGSGKIFKGTVTKVDPSSTLVSGVVNYKVTVSIDQMKELRPGMTANMTINVKNKPHVLAVPARAIITDKTGKKTLRIVTNIKTKAYKEVDINTGFEGDGGMIEVTSGLQDGDEFVVLIKTA